MFDKPASAIGIQWADHNGRLMLIEPHAVETGVKTSLGEKDAVRADVTIIDADGGPQEFHDALIFPRVLMSQTRSMIGKKVLGRLGQGQAKPGQNAPWRLDDPTDADIAAGTAYVQQRDQAVTGPAGGGGQPPF